jgi:hypothetical protein
MSIEKRKRKKGYVYVVWWKDEARRSHNKTFDLKRDAQAFEAKIKLAKRQGELADLDAGKEPLVEFVEELTCSPPKLTVQAAMFCRSSQVSLTS